MPTGCPLGYRDIVFPSTKLKGVTQGRDSGGMLIWYKANLVHSIQLIKIGKFSIWIKIKREVFVTDKDIFMCAAYIPPSESPYYNENSFSILEDEIRPKEVYLSVGTFPLPSYPHRNNFDKTINEKRAPTAAAASNTGSVHG